MRPNANHFHAFFHPWYHRKSTLVNEIKKPHKDPNVGGCFIEGKFNKHQRPDSVLVNALNAFFGDLIEADATESLVRMRWRINDAVGSGSNKILLEYVPNLQAFMDDGAEPAENLPASNRRIKFVLCKLIGAIACREHPLVLILDDLQWADETTVRAGDSPRVRVPTIHVYYLCNSLLTSNDFHDSWI